MQQTAAGALAATIGNATPATHEIFAVAEAGNLARATELVNAEPEITRLRAPDGRTALHYATAAGKPDMVMLLQGRGSELSAGPESPLLAAVDYPDQGIATTMSRILLGNASDPNARTKNGRSALQLAASRGYGEIAELLIHRGARVSKEDIKVATGDAATVLGRADSIEKVHFDRRYIQDAHGKPVVRDDLAGQPWTLVNQLVTVAHSDFGKVKDLVEAHPALLNTRATWDETPIEAAAHMGLAPMAEWLADRGAAVSTCTAVLLGLDDLVKLAVSADMLAIHERGAHDIGILAYTAYGKEQARIADRLLKAGANVQSLSLGITPLHQAANKGYAELGSVLIEHGADVNRAVKLRGEMVTPLAVAIKAKQSKMEALLKEHGGKAII